MINDFFGALFTLAVDMGFYMTIGLVLVGVLNIFIKKQWIAKHLGGAGIWPIIKASIMGVPLPLCSCGVVPTGLYLKDQGASSPSAISFLISTPQTGADSIIATYGLMGPLFAWYRPIAAFVSGVVGGIAVRLFGDKDYNSIGDAQNSDEEVKAPLKKRAVSSFKYAFGEFLDGIALHFLIGLVIAAVISVVIPADFIASIGLGSGIVSMLIMIAIGAPMYICSTSSIPIAVMLMAKGLSPGAAFVFLFMGPFTNAASLILVSKKFGRKTTVVYFLSTAVSAIGFGYLLDFITSVTNVKFSFLATGEAAMGAGPLQIAVASVFSAFVLFYALRKLKRYAAKVSASRKVLGSFEQYSVEGMDCPNCAAGLEAALRSEDGVDNAEITFESGQLKIWGTVNKEKVEKMVEAHGYSIT
jgi:uncharacterized membrane protein YraQ (UPF0718 family)/copper chaperone CopZ